MLAWLKRFGLHLTAAVGATGVFVAAAAVGANQNRQPVAEVAPVAPAVVRTRTAERPRPTVVVAAPTPASTGQPGGTTPVAPVTDATHPTPDATQAPAAAGALPSTPQAAPGGPVLRPGPPPDKAQPPPRPTQTPTPAQLPVTSGETQAQPGPGAPKPGQEAGQPPTPHPTPTHAPTPHPSPTPAERVAQERSLAGTIREVNPDSLVVLGVGGHTWHVVPAPGAQIRLNGRAARLDTLQLGDSVVILGKAQPNQGPGSRFLAHAITARRK